MNFLLFFPCICSLFPSLLSPINQDLAGFHLTFSLVPKRMGYLFPPFLVINTYLCPYVLQRNIRTSFWLCRIYFVAQVFILGLHSLWQQYYRFAVILKYFPVAPTSIQLHLWLLAFIPYSIIAIIYWVLHASNSIFHP